MSYKIYKTHAFASSSERYAHPASGNPAGVVISGAKLSLEQMSELAVSLATPITSFVTPISHDSYEISYRSPDGAVEELCGHGTIAVNIVLAIVEKLSGKFSYMTDHGLVIPAFIDDEKNITTISLPAYEFALVDKHKDDAFLAVVKYIELNHNIFDDDIAVYRNPILHDYIIQIKWPFDLSKLIIDIPGLKSSLLDNQVRAVAVTSLPETHKLHVDYQTR